jgi:uncharacterized protein YdaU (DUF1376 family)
MTDLAWIKTYIGTETALTAHLTAEEFGAYERLRRHYWQHGMLPDDDARLMRVTGVDPDRWEAVRSGICSLFEDGWRLPRLDEERTKAADKREIAIGRAKKGADARWKKNASSNPISNASSMHGAMPKAMLEQCPSASASDEVRYEDKVAPTHAHTRTRKEQPPHIADKVKAGQWLDDHGVDPFAPQFNDCVAKMVAGALTWADVERAAAA